ncbi:uncharacterized protein LOC110462387 [Mizuhopecten yessoensis]|uniref:uncharacterized protein LOC110462387 n=1 Tax=Mizuhopecten yessoensis TaxID=6573 RepID=UPI000B45ACE8|nr:uncharacterized protein LOC110462387 [Mizuhopecten yessoensis]
MIDDQSNKSLAVSDFFSAFGDNSKDVEYILSSCAGKFVTAGRRATGYVVESLDRTRALNLPEIIECNDIPNNRSEIPSPVVASTYPHLQDVASHIPEVDQQANIELLIGRDLIEAHHVLDHRIGTNGLPYAQRLPLGWVIIGEVCLGKVHTAEVVNVNKTNVLNSGRPTLFELCDSDITVKCDSVFKKTSGDEKPGLSIEDQVFFNIMDVGFAKTDTGQWTAPLPFREKSPVLPNNKPFALSRAKSFDASLQLNPVKRNHAVEFMENLFKNGHAELAPEIPTSNERWYLPLFGVYHPMKPDKIRMVFDSSAKYQDVSLNDVLLKGPDLCSSLLGILLRFRREAVAVTMDVEQMFYNFKVPENQMDFLRFLWHMDNNPEQPLVDYRMTVHVFGNRPSPAVATYGMRRSVEGADPAVKDLVNNNFYVDDGLLSCADEEEAIQVVHKAKQALHDGGNLRLHKFTSNSRKVLDSFDPNDLAKDLKDLDLGVESLPIQRSLGLLWDTEKDDFTFKVSKCQTVYKEGCSIYN